MKSICILAASLVLATMSFAQGMPFSGESKFVPPVVSETPIVTEIPTTAAPGLPIMTGEATQTSAGVTAATKRPNKPFIKRFVFAGAACGLGIGLSANPATAAEIGLPILLGGNYLAFRLYQNHPKLSAFVQYVSPLGCMNFHTGHSTRAAAKTPKTTKPPVKNPPTTNPPSGGGTGSGGGSGSGSGGGAGGSGGGSGSGGSGGSGGGTGGSGGGGNGGGGGGNPPPAPCTVRAGTDCGIGNGGINAGSPKSGPAFTPPGHGGTPGAGSKNPN